MKGFSDKRVPLMGTWLLFWILSFLLFGFLITFSQVFPGRAMLGTLGIHISIYFSVILYGIIPNLLFNAFEKASIHSKPNNVGVVIFNITVTMGIILISFGFTQGKPRNEFPWFIDLVMVVSFFYVVWNNIMDKMESLSVSVNATDEGQVNLQNHKLWPITAYISLGLIFLTVIIASNLSFPFDFPTGIWQTKEVLSNKVTVILHYISNFLFFDFTLLILLLGHIELLINNIPKRATKNKKSSKLKETSLDSVNLNSLSLFNPKTSFEFFQNSNKTAFYLILLVSGLLFLPIHTPGVIDRSEDGVFDSAYYIVIFFAFFGKLVYTFCIVVAYLYFSQSIKSKELTSQIDRNTPIFQIISTANIFLLVFAMLNLLTIIPWFVDFLQYTNWENSKSLLLLFLIIILMINFDGLKLSKQDAPNRTSKNNKILITGLILLLIGQWLEALISGAMTIKMDSFGFLAYPAFHEIKQVQLIPGVLTMAGFLLFIVQFGKILILRYSRRI